MLAATPLADRYWLWSGALLGWAREGRILAHDTADVDFGYFAADGDLLRSSLPALEPAGFALYRVLRNNEGTLTGVVLIRSGIHFDFLAFFPAGASRHVYSVFEGFQIIEAVPAQELERFTFCRRRWLKAADHERELTALYGDWRTPRPDWDTVRDSPAIVSRAAYIPRPCDPFDVSDHVAHV